MNGNNTDKIETWQMVQPTAKNKETGEVIPGKLAKASIPVPTLGPGDVLVKVAGCGVCHTDLGYFFDGVPTVSKPPLTLGHEISGTVVAGDEKWIGKEVIILPSCPAVSVCFANWSRKSLFSSEDAWNSIGSMEEIQLIFQFLLLISVSEEPWKYSFGTPCRGG